MTPILPAQPLAPLTQLRRRWWGYAGLCSVLLALGYALLHSRWQTGYALRWAGLAAAVLAYQLGILWRGLPANHRAGETTLLPTFGAGNMLTMLRGVGIAFVAGFLFLPRPPGWLAWTPAILYALASIADYLDGYVARKTNHATALGSTLDVEFDSMGMLITVALAVHYGLLPGWYLLLGLSRYLFVWGIWWRKRRGRPVYDLPPSTQRRNIAGAFMGFMSVMLWPIIHPPGSTLAGFAFGLPFVLSFTRDWLVVSGQLDPAAHGYRRVMGWIDSATRWLPVILRVAVAVAAASLLRTVFAGNVDWPAAFGWPTGIWPRQTATILIAILIIGTFMVLLGIIGRLGAVLLIFPAAAQLLNTTLFWDNSLLLSSAIFLILLGSGPFALWRPDDVPFAGRPGEDGD